MLRLLRIICLLLSILGFAAYYVWTEQSSWVNAFDWHVTKLVERGYPKRLKELKKKMSKRDVEVSLREIDELRNACGDVQFADRHFLPWRGAVELMSETLAGLGRYSELILLMEDATRRDPTNIPFSLRYATALIMEGGAKNMEKAAEELEHWKNKIPTYPDLIGTRLLLLAKQGVVKDLAEALVSELPRGKPYLLHGWQVFLFPQGEGEIVKSPLMAVETLPETGRVAIDYTFRSTPSKLFQLRLDAPIFVSGCISNSEVQLWQDDVELEQEQPWKWTGFVTVEPLSETAFAILPSKDPRMRMRFPKALPVSGVVRLRVEFDLDPVASPELRQTLAEPNFRDSVRAALRELDPELDLDLFSPLPKGATQ